MSGERHFRERREQTAIRAIVIREHQPLRSSVPSSASAKAFSRCGSSRSAGVSPISPYTCAKCRRAEPIAARAEIDEPQRRRAVIRAQLRRERLAHIAHRRERRDDERHRRDDTLRVLTVAPRSLHRQRVLAHGDRDPECGAKLFANRAHRRVRRSVFARLAAGRHPVRRQADLRAS